MQVLICNTDLLFGLALMASSFSKQCWLMLVLMFVAGFGMIVSFVAAISHLQTIVAEDRRGMILALHSMSFLGFTPVGSVLLGTIAK